MLCCTGWSGVYTGWSGACIAIFKPNIVQSAMLAGSKLYAPDGPMRAILPWTFCFNSKLVCFFSNLFAKCLGMIYSHF